MTLTERARDHWSRCQQQVGELRVLAMSEDSLTPPGQLAAQTREATNVVIAEVEAASRTVLGDSSHQPGSETFFWVRVARLTTAADQAVDAARCGDLSTLRAHVRHFDTLTSAIWAVQNAMYGQDQLPVATG